MSSARRSGCAVPWRRGKPPVTAEMAIPVARICGGGSAMPNERAATTVPDSDGALAARRGLVGLATTAGRPGGAALAALVEADHVPVDVLAWARELSRAGNHDDARAMYELARALGARLDRTDEE